MSSKETGRWEPSQSQMVTRVWTPDEVEEQTAPEGEALRTLSTIYSRRIKIMAAEKDALPGKPRAKRLQQLIGKVKHDIATKRRAGDSHENRIQYIKESAEIKEIQRLYLELGIAEMIVLGDWSVSRTSEIPEAMGIDSGPHETAPFATLESEILYFYEEHGVVDASKLGDKLIHMDIGCGNAVVGQSLRTDNLTSPFGNNRTLPDYWGEVGFADRMYFSINDLIASFIKEEHRENPALHEFINTVATLLTRRLYFGKDKLDPTLAKLPSDPNQIVKIFKKLHFFIKNFSTLLNPDKKTMVDVEFLSDEASQLTPECRELVEEYFYGPEIREKIENSTSAVWIGDHQNRTIFVNRKFCEMTGKTKEELKGKTKEELNLWRATKGNLGDPKREGTLKLATGFNANVNLHSPRLGPKAVIITMPGETEEQHLSQTLITSRERWQTKVEEYEKTASQEFLDKYFKPEFHGSTKKLDEQIAKLDEKLAEAERIRIEIHEAAKAAYATFTQPITPDAQKTIESERTAVNQRRTAWEDTRQQLTDERRHLIDQRDLLNLASHVTIHPHNVILGDFDEFGEIIPDQPLINLATLFRSSSHATDTQYTKLTETTAKRLAPGGIIVCDGKKESYTRFERLEELEALQKKLGTNYKISAIVDTQGAIRSILIERILVTKENKKAFFSDDHKEEALIPDCSLIPISDVQTHLPRLAFKNRIIKALKELIIDPRVKAAPEDKKGDTLFQSRLLFKGIHEIIDAVVEKTENLDEAILQIAQQSDLVRQQLDASKQGTSLMHPDFRITTYPRKTKTLSEPTNETRSFRAQSLPRNLDIPNLNHPAIEYHKRIAINCLLKLRLFTGKSPIKVIEFEGCFTNTPMITTLRNLLGQNFEDLVEIETVSPNNPAPNIDDNTIYIIGGSIKSVNDPEGKQFTQNFSQKLLERIQEGANIRAYATCYGSESILEAFGNMRDNLTVETTPGALQFGAFPIEFTQDTTPSTEHLAGKQATVTFTRGEYSEVEGYEDVDDMQPLAFECKEDEQGELVTDPSRPISFSLLDGAVITAQPHFEVNLKREQDLETLRRHLQRSARETTSEFSPTQTTTNEKERHKFTTNPSHIYTHQVDIPAVNAQGTKTQWLENDVGAALFAPILATHAKKTLNQLAT